MFFIKVLNQKRLTLKLLFIVTGFIAINFSTAIQAQAVNAWVTSSDKSKLMQKQATINFGASTNSNKITLNESTKYQSIDGFGHCLTEGSAEVISGLAEKQQDSLLNDLFNVSKGIGMSVIRVTIGASDLGNGTYTYDEVSGTDPNLTNFSFKGVDSLYLIPILKKVVAINPNIKILGSPWTAPTWMKTIKAFKGGHLATAYYAAYANYFVKYIQGMKANGINIWAITTQNEPQSADNTPSMQMTMQEQTDFINNNLGPAFKAAGITTKIIAYDHNCDVTDYPIFVCNNSAYVDGSAFHFYGGPITAMTTVYNATHKNVYFTEYCTCSNDFAAQLSKHMQSIMIGSLSNWSKVALEWNLATNASLGPHTDNGGCGICYGGVTINNATSYSYNSSYYIVAQMSKVMRMDAVRIASSSTNSSLPNVACINADSSRSLVTYNNSGSAIAFDVVWNGKSFPFTLTANSVASFTWQPYPDGIENGKIPEQYAFANLQTFPQPFTSSTRISFNLTKACVAKVLICNGKGTVISSLMNGLQEKGNHALIWNGLNGFGRSVSAGVYIVKVEAEGYTIAKRIMKQ